MKWTDNWLLTGDEPDLALRGQLQLAMYAVHLATGNSIYCKRIKATTVDNYVLAASTFLAFFTGRDFRKDLPTDSSMGHLLGPVLKDLRSYESVPNRREPYDLNMHTLGRSLALLSDSKALLPALIDGFEQGLCAGYRLSEWAQPIGKFAIDRPQLNHMVSSPLRTRAIVPCDIRCVTKSGARLFGAQITSVTLISVAKVWVKFRTQKNGQHGEEKLFVPNPDPKGICMVASLYRALTRFAKLRLIDGRLHEERTPLSVYHHVATNTVRLVTTTDIEWFMRRLAAQVYHLHPVDDRDAIQKWGTHSLRVGACVVLHAMGFSSLDIQWILRWRSMAFVSYLRNIALLSSRQNLAFNKALGMPLLY